MVKKIIINILRVLGGILAIVIIYVILALALPYIEVSKKATTDVANIPVYIYTNGVHTDIVLPVKSTQIDWNTKIPYANTKDATADYQYIGIGWGDKGFYLDTPTWAELKFSTAFKAAFWLGESALHCTYYTEMKEDDDCKKMFLTSKQYQDLIKFIDTKFDKDVDGKNILVPTNAVYGENDAFYEASGRYSFFCTCNTWTNNALKVAGQKAAFWTPTDSGIFQHYK
ncbi:TIGR02117 family protein [Pedobacter changchengzhani]|uniref:TIGR02117 family protein n=2 Tax=Pedobacter changchengzhani TaxID=2529274 RepID=A0A4R5MLX0_9SPHI|nr:TIGR02117 family protein [Pedobacter changchengzhani]